MVQVIFNNKNLKDTLQSFSMPFFCLKELELEQPVFGANYIKGKINAEPNGMCVCTVMCTKLAAQDGEREISRWLYVFKIYKLFGKCTVWLLKVVFFPRNCHHVKYSLKFELLGITHYNLLLAILFLLSCW